MERYVKFMTIDDCEYIVPYSVVTRSSYFKAMLLSNMIESKAIITPAKYESKADSTPPYGH